MRFYPRVSPDLGGGKQIHFKIKRSLDRSLDIALRVVTWVTSWDGAISLWSALGRISVGYFGLNGHTVVRRPFHWLTGYPVTGLVLVCDRICFRHFFGRTFRPNIRFGFGRSNGQNQKIRPNQLVSAESAHFGRKLQFRPNILLLVTFLSDLSKTCDIPNRVNNPNSM